MSRFKMSLVGFDVHNSNVDEIVVDSLYPNPKIDTKTDPPHTGIINLNWNDVSSVGFGVTKLLYSFPHNYNVTPTVFASYEFSGGQGSGTLPFQYGALGIILIDADAKNINLKYFSFDLFGTAITPFVMKIRFYVMAEQGLDT